MKLFRPLVFFLVILTAGLALTLALSPIQESRAAITDPNPAASQPLKTQPGTDKDFAPRQRVNLSSYFAHSAAPADKTAAPHAPGESGTIAGTVHSPDGAPYTNTAIIKLYTWDWQISAVIPSDMGGYYEFDFIEPGFYSLVAYAASSDPWASSVPISFEFVSETRDSDTYDLTLNLSGVHGQVINLTDGTPIADAFVKIYNTSLPFERWASTDIAGNFNIGGLLVSNTYYITGWAPYGKDWEPAGADIPITIPSAAQDYALYMSVVDGHVSTALGSALPGAYAYITDHKNIQMETWTDADGAFQFSGLPRGAYDLQVLPPPEIQGLLASPIFNFRIQDATIYEQLEMIHLPLAPKIIRGQITDKDSGLGIDDAQVWASRLDATGYNYTAPDASGVFTLYLSGGAWEVGIEPISWPADWFPKHNPITVKFKTNFQQETRDMHFEVLRADSAVTGSVVCPGGVPCAGDPAPGAFWIEVQDHKSFNQSGLSDQYNFDIPIRSGWNRLSVYVSDPALHGPQDVYFFAPKGAQSYDLGALELIPRSALISGTVYTLDELGQPQGLSETPVFAWQPEQGGWSWTLTDPTGAYTLPVFAGEWHIIAEPYLYSPYVVSGEPVFVFVRPGDHIGGIDFQAIETNAMIHGTAVNINQPDIPLEALEGWTWVEFSQNPAPPVPYFEGPVNGGQFQLKVIGDESYNLGLWVSPYAPYLPGSVAGIIPPAGEILTVAVPLVPKQNHIAGRLLNGLNGDIITGVEGKVYAADEFGKWSITLIDEMSGTYDLSAAARQWKLNAAIDPSTGWVINPEPISVTVAGQQVITRSLELWPIDSLITGTVFDPDGAPYEGAFVFAEGEAPNIGHFNTYTVSNSSGYFELFVPNGKYRIGADHPRESGVDNSTNWINPPLVENLTPAPGAPAGDVSLRFSQPDGLISGVITLPPGAVKGSVYIWAWSKAGGWNETKVKTPGHTVETTLPYSLPVSTGSVWYVGAVYEDPGNKHYYQSQEVETRIFLPATQARADLLMQDPADLPNPLIISFDAARPQTIPLPNGVRLDILAGTLADSGEVTLYLFPTGEYERRSGQEILGLGYDIWATDSNGRQIMQFIRPVLITLPYPSDNILAQLGIDEAGIQPGFYSPELGRWVILPDFVMDQGKNILTFQVDHFTRFGNMRKSGETVTLYLPALFK